FRCGHDAYYTGSAGRDPRSVEPVQQRVLCSAQAPEYGGDDWFRALPEVGDAVEITVRDNGIGIPEELKDRLVQPFFTTKPTGEGTGLGLSISYDIVTQQHGGSITGDSKVGDYSEFAIRLPRNP